MRKPSGGVWAAILLGLAVYVALGYGYHRTAVACYASRHSVDNEPMVGDGAVGVAIDITLWPAFQMSNAVTSPAVSCVPRPLGA